jgi:hypothetical protein
MEKREYPKIARIDKVMRLAIADSGFGAEALRDKLIELMRQADVDPFEMITD